MLSNLWASYGYLRSTLPARPSEIRQDAEIQHRAMEIRSTRLLIGRAIFPRKLAKFCWQGRRRANTDRGSSFATIFAHTSHHLLQVNKKDGLHLRHHRRRARLRGPHQQAVSYGRQTHRENYGFCDALGAAVRCFVRPDRVRARLRLVARRAMRLGTRAGTMRRACRIVARLSSAKSRATRTLARVSERDRGSRRVGTPRMQNNPDRHPHRYPERELTTTFPFPPDMTVRPSRPPPPSPPSPRRSRSSARPPSPASLPPPCSPRCVLDSTTISPAGASDRPYPRARATRREGRTGTNYARRPPPTSLHPVSPARAARRTLPRRGSRALFPAPGARFPLSHWLVARRGTAVQILSRGAQTRPPPHRARISDSTFPSLFSLVLFSSPRTPSPTTSSRASPTSR